jgi:DNA-binding MarR family transcriptional regulator
MDSSQLLGTHRSPSLPEPSQADFESLWAEVNTLSVLLRRPATLEYSAGELSVGESSVLQILAKAGPQTVPQIARARSTSRQNIQILVNRLAAGGCVHSIINPAHRRSVLIDLTAEGRSLLQVAEQESVKIAARLKPAASSEEFQIAARVLRKLRETLNGQKTGRARPTNSSEKRNRAPERDPSIGSSKPNEPQDSDLPVNLL